MDAAALARTYLAYRRLGAETLEGPGCRAIRRDDAPRVHDVNHLQLDPGADLDAALAFAEDVLGDRAFRQVVTTPLDDAAVPARLVLEGYEPDATWQGLLTGPLLGPSPVACDIRPVDTDEDWDHLDRLVRADHLETDARNQTRVFADPALTTEIQGLRRAFASEVHFFLAWEGAEPVAFFSSWPGRDGVGMVEDLFTLPSHRGRGLARALIHHCVADARARGADAVLIGAVPDDTPKTMYAALGFAPTCLTWNWLKQLPGDTGAE